MHSRVTRTSAQLMDHIFKAQLMAVICLRFKGPHEAEELKMGTLQIVSFLDCTSDSIS